MIRFPEGRAIPHWRYPGCWLPLKVRGPTAGAWSTRTGGLRCARGGRTGMRRALKPIPGACLRDVGRTLREAVGRRKRPTEEANRAGVGAPKLCGNVAGRGGAVNPPSRNPRCRAVEPGGRMFESGRSCSRRRMTLATLLASCSRPMPWRSRNWLRCSREQKSPSAPTQIRLRGFPQSWQLLALIPGEIISTPPVNCYSLWRY